MTSKIKSFTLLVVLAYTLACVSLTPSQRAVAIFQDANTVYEETLIAAGHAYALGEIDDDQLDKVRRAGEKVELALRAAQISLDAVIATKNASEDQLAVELQLLVRYLDDLKLLWSEIKG